MSRPLNPICESVLPPRLMRLQNVHSPRTRIVTPNTSAARGRQACRSGGAQAGVPLGQDAMRSRGRKSKVPEGSELRNENTSQPFPSGWTANQPRWTSQWISVKTSVFFASVKRGREGRTKPFDLVVLGSSQCIPGNPGAGTGRWFLSLPGTTGDQLL